jgi:hypothetical protein
MSPRLTGKPRQLDMSVPDRKSKKKGFNKIQVRVIEYTIETDGELKTYRLITSFMNLALFPALLLAEQYHQRCSKFPSKKRFSALGGFLDLKRLNQEADSSRNIFLSKTTYFFSF